LGSRTSERFVSASETAYQTRFCQKVSFVTDIVFNIKETENSFHSCKPKFQTFNGDTDTMVVQSNATLSSVSPSRIPEMLQRHHEVRSLQRNLRSLPGNYHKFNIRHFLIKNVSGTVSDVSLVFILNAGSNKGFLVISFLQLQDYYRPFELTVVGELFTFKEVSHSVRDYMPHCCTDYR
jgi:hypothetical protein